MRFLYPKYRRNRLTAQRAGAVIMTSLIIVRPQETMMPDPQSRTLRQCALLWWNRARFDVCVRWRGSWPELVLHERFRGMIRAAKTVLTAIGLLAAFLTFESVWISFLFGAVVWGCTTLVEKVAFSYNSMFVHSLPDFDLQPDLWLGAFFGYAQQPGNPHQIPMVGWIMGRADYAQSAHTALALGLWQPERRIQQRSSERHCSQ